MEKLAWEKCGKYLEKMGKKFRRKNGKEMRKQSVGKMKKTKEWKDYEKFTRQNFGKKCEKNWR